MSYLTRSKHASLVKLNNNIELIKKNELEIKKNELIKQKQDKIKKENEEFEREKQMKNQEELNKQKIINKKYQEYENTINKLNQQIEIINCENIKTIDKLKKDHNDKVNELKDYHFKEIIKLNNEINIMKTDIKQQKTLYENKIKEVESAREYNNIKSSINQMRKSRR